LFVPRYISRDTDKRWRDTFGFGLIHGFGFASAASDWDSCSHGYRLSVIDNPSIGYL
jgi:hypothetical protein